MSVALPPELAAAIAKVAQGRAGLAAAAEQISADYRRLVPSRHAVRGTDDAVAYALSRMPATFAAIGTTLEELAARAPGFAPATLLDVGAGPGTATWAVRRIFPEVAAVTLVDHSAAFLSLARQLATDSGLSEAEYLTADIGRLPLGARRFDLAVLGYALTELGDATLVPAIEQLWARTEGALVIVEPGRPRDYQRLMVVRARLAEIGAEILAPCPHGKPCPLAAPDWCHFSVRLPRSREHMRMKGGSLGYEDEKFSYLVAARPGVGAGAPARIIKPPHESKFAVTLETCGPVGVGVRSVGRRQGPAFKAARKLRWGDTSEPG